MNQNLLQGMKIGTIFLYNKVSWILTEIAVDEQKADFSVSNSLTSAQKVSDGSGTFWVAREVVENSTSTFFSGEQGQLVEYHCVLTDEVEKEWVPYCENDDDD